MRTLHELNTKFECIKTLSNPRMHDVCTLSTYPTCDCKIGGGTLNGYSFAPAGFSNSMSNIKTNGTEQKTTTQNFVLPLRQFEHDWQQTKCSCAQPLSAGCRRLRHSIERAGVFDGYTCRPGFT